MKTTLRNWCKLFLSLFLIWIFIFVIAPLGERVGVVGTFHRHVHENNIDASALFYDEVAEFSHAYMNIRDSIKY
ncbi:MAG: hypothetical protein C4527_18250 [Candidatus Omnitrophota bacterium]|nr:MAG: hypothetical protein C4527_18250 [Candidatus Omnitrophota bacterium]